jgi:hypothetical protein
MNNNNNSYNQSFFGNIYFNNSNNKNKTSNCFFPKLTKKNKHIKIQNSILQSDYFNLTNNNFLITDYNNNQNILQKSYSNMTQTERDVHNLTLWDKENLSYKTDNYELLMKSLKNLYKKEKNQEKIKDLENISKILLSSKDINKSFINKNFIHNSALNRVYIENKRKENSLILNSISKTRTRFNYELFGEKVQQQAKNDFNIDFSSLKSVKEFDDEQKKEDPKWTEAEKQNKIYRKVVNDKAREESMMRDELFFIASKINEKKEEKKQIENIINNLYAEKMKDKDEFYDFKNKIKKEILNLEQKFAFSNKVLKSISKNKEEIFLNTTKKASLWMKLEGDIKKKQNELEEKLKIFEEKKNFYLNSLKINSNEQNYLKHVYFKILSEQKKYYLEILKNGYDVRYEGLTWVVKHLLEMDTNLEYHHFPKFLDHEQIDYLLNQSKLFLYENLLTITLKALKEKRQRKYEDENREKFKKIKEFLHNEEKNKNNSNKNINSYNKKIDFNKFYITKKIKLNKNKIDLKSRLLNNYNDLFSKYKEAFKSTGQTFQDEVNTKKISEEIHKSLIVNGNYEIKEKDTLLKFFESNSENIFEFKMLIYLREQIKQVQIEQRDNKNKMIEKFKEREKNSNRFSNAKQSMLFDLMFSALFGCNLSL